MAALLVLLSMPVAHARASTLKVFENLALDAPNPMEIVRNGSVSFHYDGWMFSEELVDPKTAFSGVDLTGWSAPFFESLFNPELREQIPSWMAALSKSMARQYGVAEDNWQRTTIGPFKIFSIYSADIDQVDYFIVGEDSVASIQCLNNKAKCEGLFERFVYID